MEKIKNTMKFMVRVRLLFVRFLWVCFHRTFASQIDGMIRGTIEGGASCPPLPTAAHRSWLQTPVSRTAVLIEVSESSIPPSLRAPINSAPRGPLTTRDLLLGLSND